MLANTIAFGEADVSATMRLPFLLLILSPITRHSLKFVQRCPGLNQRSRGLIRCRGLEHEYKMWFVALYD